MAQATKYFRVKDLMDRFQISRTTADKWLSLGIVPHIRIGGVIRIPAEALDNLATIQAKPAS